MVVQVVTPVDRDRLRIDLEAIVAGIVEGVPQLRSLQRTIDAVGPLLSRMAPQLAGLDLRSSISSNVDAVLSLPEEDLRLLLAVVARELDAIRTSDQRPRAFTPEELAAMHDAVDTLRE